MIRNRHLGGMKPHKKRLYRAITWGITPYLSTRARSLTPSFQSPCCCRGFLFRERGAPLSHTVQRHKRTTIVFGETNKKKTGRSFTLFFSSPLLLLRSSTRSLRQLIPVRRRGSRAELPRAWRRHRPSIFSPSCRRSVARQRIPEIGQTKKTSKKKNRAIQAGRLVEEADFQGFSFPTFRTKIR